MPNFCQFLSEFCQEMWKHFHFSSVGKFYLNAQRQEIQILNTNIKTFQKIESVNKAFLFWYWQRPKKYFFRNKTFLFFKIVSWNFQVQNEIKICDNSQNFNSFSLFRQLLFSCFLSVVWLSWNFARFHEIQFQTEPESFSFLSWKTKKFYS